MESEVYNSEMKSHHVEEDGSNRWGRVGFEVGMVVACVTLRFSMKMGRFVEHILCGSTGEVPTV